MGWLFRDLEDAPLLAAPFAPSEAPSIRAFTRFAFLGDSFLHDCEPAILEGLRATVRTLETMGLEGRSLDPEWWRESTEIFAPIQASEAARLHAGHFGRFETAIRERLEWGANLAQEEVSRLRARHAEFRARMDELFAEHELILLPCAPVAKLEAGADHGKTRARLLRYTSPFSLAGTPAVAIPRAAGGVQLSTARQADEALLAFAAKFGEQQKLTGSLSPA
jgi:aspartyl-tRNA(Asn)/glutamyl-tRNA(Gln) amidotransferase subunit A